MQIGEELEAYYRESHPGYEDLRVSDLTANRAGMECETYFFTVEFTRGSTRRRLDRVLRVYEVPTRDLGWLSLRHRREYLGMQWLSERGYPLPGGVELVDDVRYLGRPFMIMNRVAGEPLAVVHRRSSPDDRATLFRSFCRLYADLHSLPWSEFFEDSVESPASEIGHFAQLSAGLQKEGFAPAWRWLMRHCPGETYPAVIHGDFHPENVLVGPEGELCVIDWTQVRVTDYRLDLGWTLILEHSPAARRRLLSGYETARRIRVPDADYFEAASALRRLFLFATVLEDGPETVGLRPGTDRKITEFMGGHVRHLLNRWTAITGCRPDGITRHLRGVDVMPGNEG